MCCMKGDLALQAPTPTPGHDECRSYRSSTDLLIGINLFFFSLVDPLLHAPTGPVRVATTENL